MKAELLEKNMELAKVFLKLNEILYKAEIDKIYKENHHVYNDIQDLINDLSDSFYVEEVA